MTNNTGNTAGNFRDYCLKAFLTPVSLLISGVVTSALSLPVGAGNHGQHKMPMTQNDTGSHYSLTHNTYQAPDVSLVDMNGESVPLIKVLHAERPVLLNFIFTSCTTICPVMTTTFAQVQESLAATGDVYKMISISIDPERDTPERLSSYAKKFGAGPRWRFLTGDSAAIKRVQRAFNAYRGNKMNHVPLTFIKPSPAKPWIRIEGFTSAPEIYARFKELRTL